MGTPGAADEALTVGAVDGEERLAEFSSRGPRTDEAQKPDSTAPGVGIVAARAAGTSMGEPVDDAYTASSGTSMAAPHVAGAAAILAAQHPDWQARQLKDALISTSRLSPDYTVYEQGGGRVDLAGGVAQFGGEFQSERGGAGVGVGELRALRAGVGGEFAEADGAGGVYGLLYRPCHRRGDVEAAGVGA